MEDVMPEYFDCSNANGDPTGRVMPPGFPEPAQQAVIPSVVAEKVDQIKKGEKVAPVKLWRPDDPDHPLAGRVFIMDGQHRFVAACILGVTLEVEYKKFGIPGYTNGWVMTARTDTKPAKEVLREQVAKTQSKWSGVEYATKRLVIDGNIEKASHLV
jgi:hypothetical protein